MPIGPIQSLSTTFHVAGGEALIDTLYGISDAFGNVASSAINTVSMTENLKLSTDALVASEMVSRGTAGDIVEARRASANIAEELFQWNRRLAILSPLEAQDVAQATALSQAYGFMATQTMSVAHAQEAGLVTAQRMTQAMVDFTAGTGRSGHVITNLVTQLGQIQASGRATGEELRTLSEWGLPIRRYLAEAFGVSTAEIMRMQTAGELTAEKTIPAIVEGLEREFGGAAEKAGGTLSGLTASFNDLKNYALADLFGDTIDLGKEQLASLVKTLQDPEVQESIQEWGETIAGGAAAIGTMASTMNDLLVPALVGATVGWGHYAAAQRIAAIQHAAWVHGSLGNATAAALGTIRRGIYANVGALNAWIKANRAAALSSVGGIIAGAAVYAYQEHNKNLDEHTERLFENSERWETLQKAREAYANASPELREELKADMEALEASAKHTEEQTRADADAASRSGLWQNREEAARIAAQNANIRTAAVEDEANVILKKIGAEEANEIATLEAAEAERKAAEETRLRKEAIEAYINDEAELRIDRMQQEKDIETEHQQSLTDLEDEIAEKRLEAQKERDEKLISIERDRREALAQEAEAYIDTLHNLAESAANAGISALDKVVGADVEFISGSRERLKEYNDTRETLHRQGAMACSKEELEALIEQEAQAARSYVEQEAELESHLGRRLIAYTQAQALIYGVSQDATDAMVRGIAMEFGVLETASERSFGVMRRSIDVWAQSGGQNTQQVIAGFGAVRREAVETELAYERLMEQRSADLARAYSEDRISEGEYLSRLQTLGRDVSLSLGLGIDESAYSTDVTSAAEVHRNKLVEIDRNANQERIAAYQEWSEKDNELRTTYREEQQTKLEEDRQEELEKIRAAYEEELQELIEHNSDLEAEELRHLREARQRRAEYLIGIDEDAQRQIDALREKDLPLAEELAEYERILMEAEKRRQFVEETPIENYETRDAFYEPPKEPWSPPDPGQDFLEEAEKHSPRVKVPQRANQWRPPQPADSFYGSRLQPVSIVVNNNNPIVDTPERERRLAQQTREQVRATLDEWTSDALLRGRLG